MGVRSSARQLAGHRACVIETLESRQLLSAATVWASLRPLPAWPVRHHHHGVHASPKVGAAPKVKTGETGPDILGTWAGAYTSNTTFKISPGAITLSTRHKDSFTGVFDTTSIGGGQLLSTVTVTKNRAFLCVLKTAPRTQVSLAGTVTSDGKQIIGRWSVQSVRGFTTGVFKFERA
jgi:hypothetical protein